MIGPADASEYEISESLLVSPAKSESVSVIGETILENGDLEGGKMMISSA